MEAQFDGLVQVFGGQLGGPIAGLAPLIGEMLGVQRAAIDMEDDGLLHSVRVDDVIDFQIQDIVPFGVETGEPVRFSGMFHPVGSDLMMAEAKRTRIDAFGIEYEGKTGLSKSDFSWAAEVMTGAESVTGSSLHRPRREPCPAGDRRRPLRAGRRRVVVDGRRDARHGQRAVDRLGTFGWFLGVWVVIMAAMMFPSVSPTVALYARISRSRVLPVASPPAMSPPGPLPEWSHS